VGHGARVSGGITQTPGLIHRALAAIAPNLLFVRRFADIRRGKRKKSGNCVSARGGQVGRANQLKSVADFLLRGARRVRRSMPEDNNTRKRLKPDAPVTATVFSSIATTPATAQGGLFQNMP
jgi:hypothetical protein